MTARLLFNGEDAEFIGWLSRVVSFQGYDLKEHRYVACKIHQLFNDWKEDKKTNYIKWVCLPELGSTVLSEVVFALEGCLLLNKL